MGELAEDGGEVEPHAGQALVVVVVSWLRGYGAGMVDLSYAVVIEAENVTGCLWQKT